MLNTTNKEVEKGDGGGIQKRADVQQKELLKGLRESPKGATGGCPIVSSFWCPLPTDLLTYFSI